MNVLEINNRIKSLYAELYLCTKEEIEKKAEINSEITKLKLDLSRLVDVEEDHKYNNHG